MQAELTTGVVHGEIHGSLTARRASGTGSSVPMPVSAAVGVSRTVPRGEEGASSDVLEHPAKKGRAVLRRGNKRDARGDTTRQEPSARGNPVRNELQDPDMPSSSSSHKQLTDIDAAELRNGSGTEARRGTATFKKNIL